MAKGVENPDGLTLKLRDALASGTAKFDFFVEIQRDPVTHPVEDPTVSWSSGRSAKVASILLEQTGELSDDQWAEIVSDAEGASFNPWNVTAAHRPLGTINRARAKVYQELRRRREARN